MKELTNGLIIAKLIESTEMFDFCLSESYNAENTKEGRERYKAGIDRYMSRMVLLSDILKETGMEESAIDAIIDGVHEQQRRENKK